MRMLLVVLIVAAFASSAAAQGVEIAITGGGHFPLNPTVDVNAGAAVQGNVAGRIFGVPLANLYVEVPVIATFGLNAGVDCARSSGAVCEYSSWFVTPGLRLKLAPEFPVSPYFVVGGGFGRFKTQLADGGTDTETTGVFNVGGGTDFKVAPFLSLRGEVRDLYAGRPRLGLEEILGRQHNLLVTGGIVVRF